MQQKTKTTPLLINLRFYILAISLLVSVGLFAWLRINIESDQLFFIRSQQLFGLLGIVFLYIALIISPLSYFLGKQRMSTLLFARRAIGVSAFYFSLLHGIIAVWGQLGGLGQLQYLPSLFLWSLAGACLGFCILGIMAATSFDKVIAWMHFTRWKLLHRLIYIGGLLIVLHVWSIGTHLAYSGVRTAGFIALLLLFGLEFHRLFATLNKKYFTLKGFEKTTLLILAWAIALVCVYIIPTTVQNYHGRHVDHGAQHEATR